MLVEALGEVEQVLLLPLFARHAVLAAVDVDIDLGHRSLLPLASTSRTDSIATTSRRATSAELSSSRLALALTLSSSAASLERSATQLLRVGLDARMRPAHPAIEPTHAGFEARKCAIQPSGGGLISLFGVLFGTAPPHDGKRAIPLVTIAQSWSVAATPAARGLTLTGQTNLLSLNAASPGEVRGARIPGLFNAAESGSHAQFRPSQRDGQRHPLPAMDAVEKANSGHPGLPMGVADIATVLFTKVMKFDPADPHWPDRDRFILSAGHGSMLLYSALYLLGYEDMTIDRASRSSASSARRPPAIRNIGYRPGHRDHHAARSARASPTRSASPSPRPSSPPSSAPTSSTTTPG